jgi:UDP-N-acetylmuramoyl-tripeptide--D-alanyl-D-alanine ligase
VGDFQGIVTDTRQPFTESLFLALLGENTDGHLYLEQAIEKGARGLIVESPLESAPVPQWVVKDTTEALGRIAQAYRRRFSIPIVGVTGSVGKTSTKEMIGGMLKAFFPTLVSDKNYNNQIGVPQTLFQLEATHCAAVIEMGMRGMGQISWLAEVAKPTLAVITLIGVAHQELLGSRENIALAKSEIYQHLAPSGTAILPQTTEYREVLESRIPEGCSVLRFGITEERETQVRILPESVQLSEAGTPSFEVEIAGERYGVHLRAVGSQHVHNAAAALAVAHALHLPLREAISALERWEGAEGRMMVRLAPRGVTLLDDCYNAAPESMREALATLQKIARKKSSTAIMGDMKELGALSEEGHRQVGRAVADSGVETLLTVGALAEGIAQEALLHRTLTWQAFPDSATCAQAIQERIPPKSVVLVKGSRAMAMEQIVQALLKQAEG